MVQGVALLQKVTPRPHGFDHMPRQGVRRDLDTLEESPGHADGLVA